MTLFGHNDNARAVAVDASGNVIVTGQSYRDFVTSDSVTIAYSNTGMPLWTNRHNGPANGDDIPLRKLSLAFGPDDSVHLASASDGDYSDGRVFDFATIKYTVSPGAASLGITRSNASVILSWPATALSFQLQESTNLALPNVWSAVTQLAATNGGLISVAVPANAARKFFRLRKE